MAIRMLISRANCIKTKLETVLQAAISELDNVSYQYVGHASVRETEGGASETHFNLKIISSEGKNLVNRHRMVYDLLSDDLESGLALSITAAKTPKKAGLDTCTDIEYHKMSEEAFAEACPVCQKKLQLQSMFTHGSSGLHCLRKLRVSTDEKILITQTPNSVASIVDAVDIQHGFGTQSLGSSDEVPPELPICMKKYDYFVVGDQEDYTPQVYGI
ncbi:hypothetical protein OROMI_018588 [Orobanche minor]